MRSAVGEMILRTYEMQRAAGDDIREEAVLDPPINNRLDRIRCPTLVMVGDEDLADGRRQPEREATPSRSTRVCLSSQRAAPRLLSHRDRER
jgi:hypothetical protein